MATTEAQARANGSRADGAIPVENPATGATVAHVATMGDAQVATLVERARRAQPGWEALGAEGRARVLDRLRRWLVDNRDRVVDTIVEETGKTREDAMVAEVFLTADSLRFWGKRGGRWTADEPVRATSTFTLGKKLYV